MSFNCKIIEGIDIKILDIKSKKIKYKYGYSYDYLLEGVDTKNTKELQDEVKRFTKIVDKILK